MATPDDVPTDPPKDWDGTERRKTPPLPREVGNYDARKIRALLECIEFSGVDLLDPEDKVSFTERLAKAKRADDNRKKRAENRPKYVISVLGAAAGGVFTLNLPDIMAWVKAHLP